MLASPMYTLGSWLRSGQKGKDLMSEYEKICQDLVDCCKHEAKQLAEFTAARRKVHWSHPSFVSFCVSVEDILSYEVKRKYQTYYSKGITSSGRVLRDVGKNLPEAVAVYEKCFNESVRDKEDYARARAVPATEGKVLWIRVAMLEGKLQAIVESILKNPKRYYTKHSVFCHKVYGEIFRSLIDGPCALKYSRFRSNDAAVLAPSPAEVVERHNKLLSISATAGKPEDGRGDSIDTEAAWDHVRSMYQNLSSTCLFGKNNVMVQPPGFKEPLQGYLTLLQDSSSLTLKWIPNSLLQDPTNTQSLLWRTVMSVDIATQIAHIHCHRAPGSSAELILIGFDGIAHPPLLFLHQPSFFTFLECLENSLLPRGCLEPPLWYIKDKMTKTSPHSASAGKGEWFDVMEVWNQVFRIRYGPHPQEENSLSEAEEKIRVRPPVIPLPVGVTRSPYSGDIFDDSDSSDQSESDDDDESSRATLSVSRRSASLVQGDWQKFQSKVSRQLLARYFYSWMSHCRHMSKVRANVSHLVGTTNLYPDSSTPYASLSAENWEDFIQSHDAESRWPDILKQIYFRGIDHEIRKEVWPYLLGVYQAGSTPEERATALSSYTEHYQKILAEWQQVEATKKELEVEAEQKWQLVEATKKELEMAARERGAGVEAKKKELKVEAVQKSAKEESEEEEEEGEVLVNGYLGSSRGSSPSLSTITGSSVGSLERTRAIDDRLEVDPEDSDLQLDTVANGVSVDLSSKDEAVPVVSDQDKSSLPLDMFPPDPLDLVMSSGKLDQNGRQFVKEMYHIDKDVPRCDRDYWFYEGTRNLQKLRNVVCSFTWTHLKEGYSQGMCDLLSPLLVVLDNEPLAYACYLKLMEVAYKLFPPNTFMSTRLANLQALLQVMEPDFYQYLSQHPMGDGLFYAYRWLLVTFKREFRYEEIFRVWETVWASRMSDVTQNFEEFFALAIMQQFKTAIMDAHLDPSDILNLFTDLAEKKAMSGEETIRIAQDTIHTTQSDLTKRDS